MSIKEHIAIGRVIGPAEETGKLKIKTKDNDLSKIGEYVFYEVRIQEEIYQVFASITERQISRNINSSYLASPDISATDISDALGLDNALSDVEYELTASILGYFDKTLASFVNPRINPNPNTVVYIASDASVQNMLFSRQLEQTGSAHVGNLLLRQNLPAVINIDEMISTHFAILAGTGSGKSYLARVLIEEMMKPYNGASICIFDPHGEYATFESSKNGLGSNPLFKNKNYSPQVKIFTPGSNLQFALYELGFSEISSLLPNLTDKMKELLGKLIDSVFKQARRQKREWTYNDLIREIDGRLDDENCAEAGSLQGLRWRLESRFGRNRHKDPVFVDEGGVYLKDIFKPGLCSIIDLSQVEEEEQQVIAHILLSKAYDARVRSKNQMPEDDPRNGLEYPVFALLEEAHRFAPQGDNSTHKLSSRILRRILAEGRKFGIGAGLITQRPGKLDQNVLSQCMTQFLMRIINPIDQESVKQGVEGAGRDLLSELPALSRGQAIITGVSTRTPVLVKVRNAITEHGGNSISPSEEWQKSINDTTQKASIQEKTATMAVQDNSDEDWL